MFFLFSFRSAEFTKNPPNKSIGFGIIYVYVQRDPETRREAGREQCRRDAIMDHNRRRRGAVFHVLQDQSQRARNARADADRILQGARRRKDRRACHSLPRPRRWRDILDRRNGDRQGRQGRQAARRQGRRARARQVSRGARPRRERIANGRPFQTADPGQGQGAPQPAFAARHEHPLLRRHDVPLLLVLLPQDARRRKRCRRSSRS